MKNIITTLVFIQLLNVACMAQSFTWHSESPFGIKPVKKDDSRSASKVMFYDFDLDGDLDLFMSGLDYVDAEVLGWENLHYFLEMQENVGDKFNPVFAERTDAFDNFPFPTGLFFPAIGDVNGDGLADVIMNGEIDFIGNTSMLYAPNTGTVQNPAFEVTRFDSMGLDNFVTESFFDPALVDLDSDGDLDILMSGFDPAFAVDDGPDMPRFYYAKNFGTSQNPDFRGWYSDPYGLISDTLAEVTTVGDIDNDGDMDVVGAAMRIPADSIHSIKVHLNSPTPEGKPVFNGFLESPFGLPVSQGEEQFLFPTLVDLDGDGDLDLFVFKVTADGTILEYYENALCTVSVDQQEATICQGEQININGVIYDQPGVYSIFTTDPEGCATILELTLLVEPTYTVTLDESICDGEVFSIGPEDFTEEGQYQIPLFTKDGCDSLIVLNLTVFEVDNTVMQTEQILTANQEGAVYQWINCDTGLDIPGATSQSFEVLVTGNYAVEVNDGSCTEASECVFVMITGLQDELYAREITIYPNPAHSWISIRNETAMQISAVELFSVSGQSIGEHIDPAKTIDVSSIERGVYLMKIHVDGQVAVRKVVVI